MADSIPSYSASSFKDDPLPLEQGPDNKDSPSATTNSIARRVMHLGLVLVVLGGLLAFLIPPTAHVGDRYRLGLSPSSWIALAWTANNGEFYPPLHDDQGRFGGTRYMPVPIMLLAGAARISGEYVKSGKIVSFFSTTVFLAVLMVMLRQNRCTWLVSLALASVVVMSQTGQEALTAIRCDALPTAMQLGALWLVTRSRSSASIIAAALLCTLGVFTKLSAVWAAGAIGLWLLFLDRKALVLFVASGLVSFGVGMGLVHWISDGRFIENLTGLSVSGIRGKWTITKWGLPRLLKFITEWSPVMWTLMPMALLSVLWAAARREWTPTHVAYLLCGPMMVVLYADVGVGENHLIEPLALTTVLVGHLWGRASESPRAWNDLRALIVMAIIAGAAASMLTKLWPEIRRSIDMLRTGEVHPFDVINPLSEYIAPETKLLSEDAYLPVLMNQRPIVTDAFMLLRIDQQYPEWVDGLIDRIKRQEFDVIVLFESVDRTGWYFNQICFGPRIITAIDENYEEVAAVYAHHVFVRRKSPVVTGAVVTTQPAESVPASQPSP